MSNTAEPASEPTPEALTLARAVDPSRDHVRGGDPGAGATSLVIYGDYLCPYCRRIRRVIARLRETLGEAWMNPQLYRIGASRLANDILMQLVKEKTGAYQSLDYFSKD